jgi:hypothetical protein
MKTIIQAVIVAAVLAAPVASFAQSNAPVSRAQVRAELVQIEQAGYHPGDDDVHYPAAAQAAEARVAAQNGATSGYGGVADVATQSGGRKVSAAEWNAMYSRP